ncbi:MAG: TROVE domain-containing protein [Cyanobacteriota bacterium]
MKKIEALFKSVYNKCKYFNYQDAPTYVDDIYTRAVKSLALGTFENSFYATGKELSEEAINTFYKLRDRDPEFLAKAIVHARNNCLIRLVPIIALVVLSTGNDKSKEYTKKIFNKVIKTPGDLQDFMSIIKNSEMRSCGRMIKSLINQWLENISEIHAIKYGSNKQNFSLRDIYRITRPKLTGRANEIARYIVKNELSENTELEQIKGYEEFKRTRNPELILKYNLPFEVVTSQVATDNGWKAIYKAEKLPFMFMMRNLNNAYKYNCFNDLEILQRVCNTLTDPLRVKTSKQFPYRFYTAIKNLKFFNRRINHSLSEALELSVTNFPEIKGKTFVALDFSSSMTSLKISKYSDMKPSEISNLFGAAIFKKSQSAQISGFNENFIEINNLSRKDTILNIFNYLNKNTRGGGTSLSEPIKYLLQNRLYVENLIIITDSISWYDHFNYKCGCMDFLRQYKNELNPNIKTIVLNIIPYKFNAFTNREPNLFFVSGWSEIVLNYISSICNGFEDQIQSIKDIEL